MKQITLYSAMLLLFSFNQITANTFIFTGNGNYNNPSLWTPSYPGFTINSGDTVIISTGSVCMSLGLVNTIINNGVFIVNGKLECQKLTNNHHFTNYDTLEMVLFFSDLVNNDLFVNNGVQIFHAQEIAPGGNNDIVNNGMYKNYGEISVDFFEDNQITFENADTLINYGILEGRDTIAPCDACSCFLFDDASLFNEINIVNSGTFINNEKFYGRICSEGKIINNDSITLVNSGLGNGIFDNFGYTKIKNRFELTDYSVFNNYGETELSNGTLSLFSNSTINNSGIINNNAYGNILVGTAGNLNLLNDSELRLNAVSSLRFFKAYSINNANTLISNQGSLIEINDSLIINTPFYLGGNLNSVEEGGVNGFFGTLIVNDSFEVSQTGELYIYANLLNYDTLVIKGFMKSADFGFGNIYNFNNSLMFIDTTGEAFIEGDSCINYIGGKIANKGFLKAGLVINNGEIIIDSLGTLDNRGMRNYGQFTIEEGGDLIINGDLPFLSGSNTDNFGNIYINSDLLQYNGSVFTNHPSSIFQLNLQGRYFNYTSGIFNGLLSGTGSVQTSPVIMGNSGIMSPGINQTGCLIFLNDLELNNKTEIDIFGYSNCSGYDQIRVKAPFQFTAADTLNVNFGNFIPKQGETFQIVSGVTGIPPVFSGEFDTIVARPKPHILSFLEGYLKVDSVYTTYYRDVDGDGYGNDLDSLNAYHLPNGYSILKFDCNDNNFLINPAANEHCSNMVDDNCNGIVDETPFMSGLIGWYPFDGNALDSSLSDNNGVVFNAIPTTDRFDNAGKAFYFNGIDSHIEFPFIDTSRFSNSLTISAWVYYSDIPVNNATIIAKPNNGTNKDDYQIWFNGGRVHSYSSNGFGLAPITDNPIVMAINTWFHISHVFNRTTGKMYLYINAEKVDSAVINFELLKQIENVYVGVDFDNGSLTGYFGGKIDEVKVFNLPLNENQIYHVMHDYSHEICNNIDDNCNGIIDEGVKTTYYRDFDQDGFGSLNEDSLSCNLPVGYVNVTGDCNDMNNQVNPAATENCNNGIDDNCNGIVDETVLMNGLTSWYPFHGNADDESENDNHGMVSNAVLTTDRFNHPDSAYLFNGTSARINVLNNSNMNHANISISAWIHYTTIPSGTRAIVTKQYTGNSTYYLYWDAGRIKVFSSNGTVTSTLTDNTTVYPTGETWLHIVFTFDDVNNTNKLYVNGILRATGSPTYSLAYNTNPVVIGAGWTGSVYNSYYNGKIDDVRIYNYALTQNQVLHVMNDVHPEICNGIDDDCDGMTDEDLMTNLFYRDLDGDGYGNSEVDSLHCIQPIGYILIDGDCNDANSNIFPGAPEICDNLMDDNCNGFIDETILMEGLTAWYPFHGNADDESENDNHGMVFNASLTTDRFNHPDSAYLFNGTSARINVLNNSNMNHANISISAWIHYTTIPSGTRAIVTKQYTGNSTYYLYWDAGRIKVFSSNGTLTSTLTDNTTVYPTGETWLHIVFTFDDVNNTNKLYVNGILRATGSPTYSLAYNTNPVVIGAGWTGSVYNSYYNGKIDDVRIYNYALTQNQVLHVMNDVPTEICNGIDDDCDGLTDEGVQITYYQDSDNDNFGNNNITLLACSPPTGYKVEGGDCDDNNPLVFPGTIEFCNNGIDDNCNGIIDETVLMNGLTAWYPFNGNANDESVNDNHGTVFNASLATDRFNHPDSSYLFNGSSSRINVMNNANMNHANISISAWIHYTTIPSGTRAIVTKQYTGNSTYYLYWDAGRIKVFSSNGTVTSTLTDNTTAYPTGETWLHIVFTFDDTNNTSKLYVNGILRATGSPTYSLAYNTNPVVIGAGWTGSVYNSYYNGKIDDIRIYDYVLTQNQVLHVMNDLPTEVCNGIDDDCDGIVDEGIGITNTFNNSGGNNAWELANNWSLNIVPSRCHDIIIPGSYNVILTGDAEGASVWLQSGAQLNVNNSGFLELFYGNGIFTFKNEGILTNSGIIILYKIP